MMQVIEFYGGEKRRFQYHEDLMGGLLEKIAKTAWYHYVQPSIDAM